MQLIILGMHRSGTSVLARILNLMGAYFGPEGISTGANGENPKGFWERRDVRFLNDSVLHAAGCDWNRVSQFDIDALSKSDIDRFSERAARLVLEMDAHRPWILKDPRLCILLPLWLRVLEAPVCVHIHRHPVEVASSLLRRNGMPIDVGLNLWEYYVRSAWSGSTGLPRINVSHQKLMQQPMDSAALLLQQLLKIGVSGLRAPAKREISAFVRDDLYRERDRSAAVECMQDLPQVALFDALEADAQVDVEAGIDAGTLEVLADYESSLPPLRPIAPELPASLADGPTGVRLAYEQQDNRILRESIVTLERALEARIEQCVRAERETMAARAAVDRLEEEARSHGSRIADMQLRIEQGLGRVAQLEADLRGRDASNSDLKLDVQFARGQVVDLKLAFSDNAAKAASELASASAIVDELRAAATQGEAEATRRFAEIATLTGILIENGHRFALEKKLHADSRKDYEVKRKELVSETEQYKRRLADRLALEEKRHADSQRNSEAKRKELSYEIEQHKRQLAGTIRGWEARMAVIADRLQRELRASATLRASRSWKITGPLRKLGGSRASAQKLPLTAEVDLLRRTSLFDRTWYLAMYQDIAESGMDPVEHYLYHGGAELRNPGPRFDTGQYLKAHPTVAATGENALIHFLLHGHKGEL